MICLTAITYAAEGLFPMYDLTGETEYLRPVRKCVSWGRSLPDTRKTYLYDPQNGQPVVSAGDLPVRTMPRLTDGYFGCIDP